MKFFICYVITLMAAALGALEKYINGYTTTFWVIMFGSFFFLLCAYGASIEEEGTKKPKPDDDVDPFN
jgi:hypothetical protein